MSERHLFLSFDVDSFLELRLVDASTAQVIECIVVGLVCACGLDASAGV